jgi:hypothetical protein
MRAGKAYPMAPLCITVARKPSYYLWNIVFPVFWVVSAAGVSMVGWHACEMLSLLSCLLSNTSLIKGWVANLML